MRVFFKALASVGMIVLSTAAAIGIRHLVRKRRSRHEDQPAEPATETKEADATEEENASDENPEEEEAKASEASADDEHKEDASAE